MEDGDETNEETAEEEEVYRPIRQQYRNSRKKCNQRIDELATPPKRTFLALWNEHGHILPCKKVQNLKLLLQQLYAMSPEETARYFAELRAHARVAELRRKFKQRIRKYLQEIHNQRQRERAYRLFRKILKCGLTYAVQTPVPPLVSIRLRYLSDIILEQLCDLKKIDVPTRCNPDIYGNFLISVADWMAIAVERLYYAAQLSINEMTNDEEESQKMAPLQPETPVQKEKKRPSVQAPDSYAGFGQPVAVSSPRNSFDRQASDGTGDSFKTAESRLPPPEPYYSILETQPFYTSTPKKLPGKGYSYNPRQIKELMNVSGSEKSVNKTRGLKDKSQLRSQSTTRRADSSF